MGGSGIAAKIVFDHVKNKIKLPYYINKDYKLPGFVNKKSLVVVCSYSGNTEEALSCFKEAIKNNSEICCISSGGILLKQAIKRGFNYMSLPKGNPPRTMIAFAIILLFNVLNHYSIFKINVESVFKMVFKSLDKSKVNKIKSDAKKLSDKIYTTLPIVYSSDNISGIGVRLKQQLNENSKILCIQSTVPEMNHNEILGWTLNKKSLLNKIPVNKFSIIFLRNNSELKRNQIRLNILKKELTKINRKNIFEVTSKGGSMFEEMFYLIHLCDWVSYFLALKHKIDPINIDAINMFKKELSRY